MKRYIKRDINWAKSILSKYTEDVISFIREYKDYVDNLSVYDFVDDDIVESPKDSEVQYAYAQYVTIALNEGIITESKEFDNIYDALCILES